MVRMATATEATYSLSGFVHNTMRVREYGCPMQYCTQLNIEGTSQCQWSPWFALQELEHSQIWCITSPITATL